MSATATPPAPMGTTTPPPASAPAEPRPWRFTREEYYKLGELGFFAGKRVELIRGEVFEMSPIGWLHRIGVGLVSEALAKAFATGFHIDVQQPFSIPGALPGTEPQPDLTVLRGSRRNTTAHPTTAELLVEVADATLFYDTTTKAELYATAGITDYWVLDVTGKQLHVFRDPGPIPDGGFAYRTHLTLNSGEVVTPVAAPGTEVAVADLLP